jgi:hypothetical protein
LYKRKIDSTKNAELAMWVWVVWKKGGKNVEKNYVGGNCGKFVENNNMGKVWKTYEKNSVEKMWK